MCSTLTPKRIWLLLPRLKRVEILKRYFSSANEDEPVWKDPFKHALPKKEETRTEFEEIKIDWDYVERLMPHRVIPDVPKHESYPTPSGWCPPRKPSGLSYFVSRLRNHTFPLFLQVRRDKLDPKTMDFVCVELVEMKNVEGDVFACGRDLQTFLEAELGHPVATNIDELKGKVTVKGADRTLIEKFLLKAGF